MNKIQRRQRPENNEYFEYYDRYVSLVPDGDIIEILKNQQKICNNLLLDLPEKKINYKYAPEKWTLKQVFGHVIDVEWVFTYRALTIARGDKTALPGMDQNEFMKGANFEKRQMSDMIEEYNHLRSANIVLFTSFDEQINNRTGMASGCSFSVRSIPYIIAGHELHHINVIKERYL
ncbi:DinB family protein [Calditrichota bacterium]